MATAYDSQTGKAVGGDSDGGGVVRFSPPPSPYSVPADKRWAGPDTKRRPKPLSSECLQALNAAARAKQADFPGNAGKAALSEEERVAIIERFKE